MRVFVGIGSNLGDRERTVLRSFRALEQVGQVVSASGLYETEPVGVSGQPEFVNAIVVLEATSGPDELMERTQALERRMGRRSGHNEPREIDIDLIAFGNLVVETERLTLPHARYHERLFVLLPLAVVAPDFVCPRTDLPIGDMIAAVAGSGRVTRISGRRMLTNEET